MNKETIIKNVYTRLGLWDEVKDHLDELGFCSINAVHESELSRISHYESDWQDSKKWIPRTLAIALALNTAKGYDYVDAKTLEYLKEKNLCVIFGVSDDNAEYLGEITEELGAYDGATHYITHPVSGFAVFDEEKFEALKELLLEQFGLEPKSVAVEVVWSPNQYKELSWQIIPEMPYAEFLICDKDGYPFGLGAVVNLRVFDNHSK